jgi:predicted phosphodiesterase
MRFAIVSDIHANLQAWNAVLMDLRSLHADRIVCLGDIVGYGPNPAEVLRSVHANVNHLVLGNHDAVVCGKMDKSLFNRDAQTAIAWTCGRLNRQAVGFLRTLPLSLDGGSFRCAHGDFSNPAAFRYVIDAADALPSWRSVPDGLLFVGHSHAPGIYLLGRSGTPHLVPAQDFELEEGKRFLVNVGSVGQPRDGDARACYCLHDTEARTVCWRRIPFDLDRYRQSLREAGLPESTSFFLRHDPRLGIPPLRTLLNFSPATLPGQSVKDAVEVQALVDLQRRVRRWQTMAAVVLIATLSVAGVSLAAWWRHAHRARVLTPFHLNAVSLTAAQSDRSVLAVPPGDTPAGQAIDGWLVRLGDRRAQSIAVVQSHGGPTFVLSSRTAADPLALAAPRLPAAPGMKLCYEVLFRKHADFTGNVAVVVSLTRRAGARDDTIDQFSVKEPNQPRADGWVLAKATCETPAGTSAIEFQIRGAFAGTVEVKDLRLCRKE